MPKNIAENEGAGIPDDFVGAARAEGVEVPRELRQQEETPRQPAAPEVVVADTVQDGEQPRTAPRTPPRRSEGHDKVDFTTATPDEIQKRFDRMYRQVKAQDETQKIQGQTLEKLLKDKQDLERKLKDQDSQDALQKVRDQLQKARDNGDYEGEDRLREQIVTLRTEMEVNKRVPVATTPTAPAQPPRPEGTAFNALSTSDKAEIARWSEAADGKGNFVRPWTQAGHTRTQLATNMLAAVLADPAYEDMTMGEKLAVVDDQMGTQVPAARRGSAVMGANLRQNAVDGKPTITPDQARVAKKMFPHLKEQDAYRAYVDGGL